MSEHEKNYYDYKANLDRTYGDSEHQQLMSNLIQSGEYGLVGVLSPTIKKEGNQWCVLWGENLQDGIAGFGETPYLAILDFNKSFHKSLNHKL